MGPHRAGQLAHSDVFPGGDQPLAVTVQLVQPAGEHKPEAQRLGMDAVGPAGHQRPAFLDRTAPDHGGNPIEVVEQDVGGADQLQRERRIEDVGGSQAPMQVTGVVSHRLGQRVQESAEGRRAAGRPSYRSIHAIKRARQDKQNSANQVFASGDDACADKS